MRDKLKNMVRDVYGLEVEFSGKHTAPEGFISVSLPDTDWFVVVPDSVDGKTLKGIERLLTELIFQEQRSAGLQYSLDSAGQQLKSMMGASESLVRLDGSLDLTGSFDFLPPGVDYALFQRGTKLADSGIDAEIIIDAWDRLDLEPFFRVQHGPGELIGLRVGNFRVLFVSKEVRRDLTWELARLRLHWLDRISRERKQYFLDDLTGLYSRKKFLLDLDTAFDDQTLMLINPRHLKMFNNIYTQKIGDQILSELGQLLTRLFSFGRCYRLYSGRFGVLFANQEQATDGAGELLTYFGENLIELVSPVTHDILRLRLELQIAIATGRDSVLDDATITMAHARDVDGQIVVYGETIKSRVQEEAVWVDRLHYAMENDAVVPYFQGIHNNGTGKIDKYEALMRIRHQGTVYSPSSFMDVAVHHGFYQKLTETVITKAFQTFSKRTEKVSVNLMLNDIVREEFLAFVHDAAKKYSMPLNRVVFELLETADLDGYTDVVANCVEELHSWGAQVAIDDFGTGYSNFKYIQSLGVDILKIDGSLINNLDSSEADRAIVRSISYLAQSLEMETIAEYVESAEIQALVCDLGINGSQGYLFCKPIALDEGNDS